MGRWTNVQRDIAHMMSISMNPALIPPNLGEKSSA